MDMWMRLAVVDCGRGDVAAKITYERLDGEKIWEAAFCAGELVIPSPPGIIVGTYVVKLEWQEERAGYDTTSARPHLVDGFGLFRDAYYPVSDEYIE